MSILEHKYAWKNSVYIYCMVVKMGTCVLQERAEIVFPFTLSKPFLHLG